MAHQDTSQDDSFFRKLDEAARKAKQLHGPVLTAKYGPKMPTEAVLRADYIADALGAKTIRR